MNFEGIEPLPEGMPVVEVATPSGAVDLHNDYLVTDISIDSLDASVRVSFERTEQVPAVAGKKRQPLTLVTMALTGVSDLRLHGSLRIHPGPLGLDFLLYTDRPREGPMVELRFDSQSALVVSCRSCSLERVSARLRALPGRADESKR